MANHENLIRSLVRAALVGNPGDPKGALTDIITGNYTTTFTDGRVLIHTAEAGGEVQFSVPAGMEPTDIMALCEEAVQFIDGMCQPPTVDGLKTKRVKRLHASFRHKNFGGRNNGLFGETLQ